MYLPGIYDLRQLWALVTCDLVMCTTAHAHSGPRVFSRRCLWRYEFGNPFLVGGFNHLEKYESQWEGLSHILWNIINVWNHQPVLLCQLHVRAQHGVTSIYKLLSSVFDCLQLRKRNDLPSTLAHQAHGTCARHRHRFRKSAQSSGTSWSKSHKNGNTEPPGNVLQRVLHISVPLSLSLSVEHSHKQRLFCIKWKSFLWGPLVPLVVSRWQISVMQWVSSPQIKWNMHNSSKPPSRS